MLRVMIEVLEKSWNFQSSIGNTVRDYFKDTVTPHFFNVATRCIVLIKTAFSQARHPAPPSSLFLRNKMVSPCCRLEDFFPGSIFRIVGIEPGISRRRQPVMWNALETHSSAKWTWTYPPQTFRSDLSSHDECARISTTYLAHFL